MISNRYRMEGVSLLLTVLLGTLPALASSATTSPLCDRLAIHPNEFTSTRSARVLGEALGTGLYQQVAWELRERGDAPQAEAVEQCLRWIMTEGDVLGRTPLRGGISSTWRVQLPYGVSGVYKWRRNRNGCYSHEIATWEIDRRLGFHLVPMTVLREVDGRPGSLQFFIVDARPSYEVPDAQRTVELFVLDLLIDNQDRHDGNWIFYELDGRLRLVAIDHNLTFGCQAQARLSPSMIRRVSSSKGNALLEALARLPGDELEALLAPWVPRKRGIDRALRVRDRLVRHLEAITPDAAN